jgi:hypothetical protein
MLERRGVRFLLEAAFLGALALGLAFAELSSAAIVGLMLVGWVLVAAIEWATWRGRPHFASGLPPRYVVPYEELPPPVPLEQVAAGYPAATRDEAPTWIATPAIRAGMLGEGEEAGDETIGIWPVAAPAYVARRLEQDVEIEEIAPEELPEPDSWTIVELPPAAPAPEPVHVTAPAPQPATPPRRIARYSFDPLEAPSRRRFGRARPGGGAGLDVPARPSGVRRLPGQGA